MTKILHSILHETAFALRQVQSLIPQSLQYCCEVVKMFFIVTARDENIINVANYMWEALQHGIHKLLEKIPKGSLVYLYRLRCLLMVMSSFNFSSSGNCWKARDRSRVVNFLPFVTAAKSCSGVGSGYWLTSSTLLMVTL